jgi:hypothetical protein
MAVITDHGHTARVITVTTHVSAWFVRGEGRPASGVSPIPFSAFVRGEGRPASGVSPIPFSVFVRGKSPPASGVSPIPFSAFVRGKSPPASGVSPILLVVAPCDSRARHRSLGEGMRMPK